MTSLVSLSAAWFRRRRFGAAALLLYTALALAVMAPLAPEQLPSTPVQDLSNHVSGIIEARCALGEGQFPVRVAPHQNSATRYPIFQFYGNFPYTLGGAVYRATRANPYTVWKLEVMAFLVLGAFFTYRCGRVLTRQPLPALAAGAIFVTAPYVLTDIHGRYAFSEIISFMLLPAVFYYSWRSFVSRRLGPVLATGVAWSALALSHNVAYLYAATYFGLFFLSWLAPRRKQIVRCLRVGAGFSLGLILTAWSIIPQQQLVPELGAGLLIDVMSSNWLTPLGVLLAPGVSLPVHVPTIYINETEHFGLQVGWPILVAVGLALTCLRGPLARLHGRQALMGRFLVLFALAFVMVWTPFDFWHALPSLFNYVQFSYRLLMFTVLWGSLLAAYSLALALEGRMRAVHLAVIVLCLGWTISPYLKAHKTEPHVSVAHELANPEMGRGGATAVYLIAGSRLAETTLVHPDMNWASGNNGGVLDYVEFHTTGRLRAVLPAPQESDTLRLAGKVDAAARPLLRLVITMDDAVVATPEVPPGPFELYIPLPPAPGKSRVQVIVEGKPLSVPPPPPGKALLVRPSYEPLLLALQPGPKQPKAPQLISAGQLRDAVKFRHPTTLRIETSEPALLQMPVLFYPGMQQVTVDDQPVATRHLGKFIAVEIPPGEHVVAVRFVGVPWADRVSLAGWMMVAVGAVFANRRWLLGAAPPPPKALNKESGIESKVVFAQKLPVETIADARINAIADCELESKKALASNRNPQLDDRA